MKGAAVKEERLDLRHHSLSGISKQHHSKLDVKEPRLMLDLKRLDEGNPPRRLFEVHFLGQKMNIVGFFWGEGLRIGTRILGSRHFEEAEAGHDPQMRRQICNAD